MTILTDPPPAIPPVSAYETTETVRLVRVCAHLLPDEVIAGRRLKKLKGQLAKGLAGFVGLLVVFYAWSWWQTHSSQNDLAAEQNHTSELQSQIKSFGPLVVAQGQQAAISANLRTLMAKDLQWRDMLTTIESEAPRGVHITGVTGVIPTLPPSTPTTGGLAALNESGLVSIGTLSVQGVAPDGQSVASFVDRLAATTGLASPVPSNVSGTKGGVQFTIDMLLTSDALGGRFTLPVAPAGNPTTPTQGGH